MDTAATSTMPAPPSASSAAPPAATPGEPAPVQLTLRVPEALLPRLEAHAGRLRAATPGQRATRADAARVLLLGALDRAEAEAAELERKKKAAVPPVGAPPARR